MKISMWMPRTLAQLVVLIGVLAVSPWSFAGGPIVVGNGTAASCTEAALQSALQVAAVSGGGTIKFKCGSNPVTIALTQGLTVPDETTINGGGLVTLEPLVHWAVVVFRVDAGTTAVVKNLTIRSGLTGISNSGTLTVSNSRFSNNFFYGILSAGALTVNDSVFDHEVFDVAGGGINSFGIVTVNNSLFAENFGGGLVNSGTATINSSYFFSNRYDEGPGGGIGNYGDLRINASVFAGNVAGGLGGGGLANFASGVATIRNSVFLDNVSGFRGGGGIYNAGQLTVDNSVLEGNTTPYGGGVFTHAGLTTLNNSEITGNTASIDGGGIYTFPGAATALSDTTVTANTPNDIAP